MSADNWAICPRCADRAKAEADAAFRAVAEAYGKVSADEWSVMQSNAETLATFAATGAEATFREDYEFYGAEDGVVVADYSGHCSACGLNVDFKHEHPFYRGEVQ